MKTASVLFLANLVLCSASAQFILPWQHADATHRTVCRIETDHALRDAVVTLPAALTAQTVAFVDADAPASPLPIHVGTNGVTLLLPGAIEPGKPRCIVAYRDGTAVSPKLAEPPRFTHDFAKTELGHAWDFADGTQCGIRSWGNRPNHLGPITVKDGWLQVPVKDTDPYFIFGNMFGRADDPHNLHINSKTYRYLELRVRQSCARAEWEFFVTDRDGQYKSMTLDVHGTAAQTLCIDLQTAFPEFWDGREFRALRIDTTNDKKDVLAEVDYVRLLPVPPTVTVGPELSREAVKSRDTVTRFKVSLPRSLTAGAHGVATVKIEGAPRLAPCLWSLLTTEHGRTLIGSQTAAVPLPTFTRASECSWTIGLADDLGQPLHPVSGTLHIGPAALAAYRLTPDMAFVDLQAPAAPLSVQGLDAYGNTLPVSIRSPRWSLSGGAQASDARIKGNPASVAATFPSDKAATYRVTLSDGKGHSGSTTFTTVAYRKETVKLNANGVLVTPAGAAYFPAGGLYANWPHRLNKDGSIGRSVDLFPCGPSAYKEGYPWSPETEAAVRAYLMHCSERGINCLRLMLRNMDLVGRVDPVQLQATLHLFDLARPFGIRFNIALCEDYNKPPYVSREILDKIVLPHYTPEQLAGLPPHRARFLVRKETVASAALRYSDPDALACQQDYLRELIPVLAAREEVLCYEFENEMVFPPMSWCRATAAFIRTIDPHTLILGNPGPHDWPEPLRWRDSGCDLFSYHPYNDGQSPADHGAIIYLRSKFAAQSGLPFYTGEGGLNQNRWEKNTKQIAPDPAARGTRDQIWMSVCCGANGCLYWTLGHDLEAQEFAKIRPAFDALGLDFTLLKRQRPTVALALSPNQRDRRDAAMAMRLLDLGCGLRHRLYQRRFSVRHTDQSGFAGARQRDATRHRRPTRQRLASRDTAFVKERPSPALRAQRGRRGQRFRSAAPPLFPARRAAVRGVVPAARGLAQNHGVRPRHAAGTGGHA